MFADSFGQLQGFRNQRNSEDVRNYFQSLAEGRAEAAQNDQRNEADRADYWKGLSFNADQAKQARISDNYAEQNRLARDYFTAGRSDAAAGLKYNYDKIAADKLTFEDKQAAIEDRQAEQQRRQQAAQLFSALQSGQVKTFAELSAYKDLVNPQDFDRLTLHLQQLHDQQLTSAGERNSEFNSAHPRPAFFSGDAIKRDQLAQDYFNIAGDYPDNSTPRGADDVIGALRSVPQMGFFGKYRGGRPDGSVRLTSDSDLDKLEKDYDTALSGRNQAFKTFTTERTDKSLQSGIRPDIENLRYVPVTDARTNYFSPAVLPPIETSAPVVVSPTPSAVAQPSSERVVVVKNGKKYRLPAAQLQEAQRQGYQLLQ